MSSFYFLCRNNNKKNKYFDEFVFSLQAKSLFPGPTKTKEEEEVRVTPNHLQLFLNLAFLISQNDSRLEEADAVSKF